MYAISKVMGLIFVLMNVGYAGTQVNQILPPHTEVKKPITLSPERIREIKERSSTCSDLLVRLYTLPKIDTDIEKLKSDGIVIRRALASERHMVKNWAMEKFSQGWADEFDAGFNSYPIRSFLVTKDNQLLGVSVYDATALGVAGPIGIDENFRGKGVGKVLITKTLQAMHDQGYAYAVIGWVLPKTQEFFKKSVGAEPIAKSDPFNGMYTGVLLE